MNKLYLESNIDVKETKYYIYTDATLGSNYSKIIEEFNTKLEAELWLKYCLSEEDASERFFISKGLTINSKYIIEIVEFFKYDDTKYSTELSLY